MNNNQILTQLEIRLKEKWITDHESYSFYDLTKKYVDQFSKLKHINNNPRIILVPKSNQYQEFLARFLAGVITDSHIFLGHEKWQKKEWKEVLELTQPHLILGINYSAKNYDSQWQLPDKNLIMIPTGGTSGKIKFAIHTWETLSASVQGFSEFFKVNKVNSFCVLPLHHVSGLMQFIRSFLTQGKIIIYSYSDLKKGIMNSFNFEDFFISLVPTQLQFLLTVDPDFLIQFKTILLGGAPAWNSLLEKASNYNLNLSPTYGMTETASQVVTLKPEDFLQKMNSTGQVLPHANISFTKEKIIKIKAKSLFFGYYPNYQQKKEFITDDLGYFDDDQYLYVIGRNSQKIITGGENVFPKEVENVILETNLVKDISVIGVADEKWGEVVTAIYVPQDKTIEIDVISNMIKQRLSSIKQPKHWIKVNQLPRNQQGKLHYQTLQQIALAYLNPENSL
ncbi:MAG: 2-succinylbenzoate--CoA ligase [Crocosphaera sp.]|nr:2-succinylbenzoate--CoA ligase [Crocosphaera sp.]